jgi:prepilin-type N-terminal cleavage/methylation domain-containing protein
MRTTGSFLQCRGRGVAGFTLVELLLSMAIFGVISGAAFGLLSQNQPLFNQQQIQASLNISTRNAIAQLQSDIVNGGSGYYSSVNVPGWPVGVVINNNVVSSGGDCHSGITYTLNCFDSLTVIVADPATIPVNPVASTTGLIATASTTGSTDTHLYTTIYVLPPTGVTAATYALNYHSGDQILLERFDGSYYTTVKLTSDAATAVYSGTTYVLLTHSTVTALNGTNAAADDLTGMSVSSTAQTYPQFANTDWVIRLVPVKYYVDLTNAADPKLTRQTLGFGGSTSVLAEQIIGFKVGAALVNATGTTDVTTYNFDSSTFNLPSDGGSGYDYTMIRSVMISLVGRTPPVQDPTYVFRNSFDGGPYQIQGVSVVVNPRNLSM